jgi:hypothetical protein
MLDRKRAGIEPGRRVFCSKSPRAAAKWQPLLPFQCQQISIESNGKWTGNHNSRKLAHEAISSNDSARTKKR